MVGWFENKSAKDYFLEKSAKNIDVCYDYFKMVKFDSSKISRIHTPSDENPTFGEKLVYVMSWLSAYFDSD